MTRYDWCSECKTRTQDGGTYTWGPDRHAHYTLPGVATSPHPECAITIPTEPLPRTRIRWMLTGAAILAALLTVTAASAFTLPDPIPVDEVGNILRNHEERLVALENGGGVTTTTSVTATSTTVVEPPPPTTTTTTTQAPPPPPPAGARFDIINVADGIELWTAPYLRNLPYTPNVGWVDGDRVGYGCAYMFLQRDGLNVGRVTFQLAHGDVSAYGLINDKFMAEGVRYFDGTVSDGTRRQLNDCPPNTTTYEPYEGDDYRPLIFYVGSDGALLEDRSYTVTDGEAIRLGRLKFEEVERITVPFTVSSPFSTSKVYERVTVLAHFDRGDGQGFLPTVVVYYDSLVPDVSLLESP